MKKVFAVAVLLALSSEARSEDGPYSYEDLGKIISALCQKAAFGYRAEMDAACPQIGKRLEPMIAAEKAAKKEDKK